MKLSITALTRTTKPLTDAIVRGESVIITRHGVEFAVITPIGEKIHYPKKLVHITPFDRLRGKIRLGKRTEFPPMPRLEPEEAAKEAQAIIDQVENQSKIFCQAPLTNCRMIGNRYTVVYTDSEGERIRIAYLCPGHAQKARESAVSVTPAA